MNPALPSTTERKEIARKIFEAALLAADPVTAVERAVTITDETISIAGQVLRSSDIRRDVVAVSIGKAAWAMAAGLDKQLGSRLIAGLTVSGATSDGSVRSALPLRWTTMSGGHPLPTAESFTAGGAIIEFVRSANRQNAAIVFMISGGGSAMVEVPIDPRITLDDLASVNSLLLENGVPINEINVVRKTLSAIKGGRLASNAPLSFKVGLIVSDTNPGDEASVASGPTFPAPTSGISAIDILHRYGLFEKIPAVVRAVISTAEADAVLDPPAERMPNRVLLNSDDAIAGAITVAPEFGLEAMIVDEIVEQEVAKGCRDLAQRFRLGESAKPICLLSAGEFLTPVTGNGLGGRNTETALRMALTLKGQTDSPSKFTALFAGTDGLDGNCPAAGAMIDETTLSRAQALELDPEDFLARSDSFSFFDALGDAIVTGATGTNVRDLRILLGWP